jgi:hypothetical protein
LYSTGEDVKAPFWIPNPPFNSVEGESSTLIKLLGISAPEGVGGSQKGENGMACPGWKYPFWL